MEVKTINVEIQAPIEGVRRVKTFLHLLEDVVPKGRTLLDLGAGPCLFARKARDAGYDVTAVDGRTARLPDDLDGVRFIRSDVRDFDVTGYDVIAILGLLYHLTLADQEDLLRRCAYGATVILDTQIHVPEMVTDAAGEWARELIIVNGYEGVQFPEGDNPMASMGNPVSFWHTGDSLLQLFERCGYGRARKVDPPYLSKYGARAFYVLDRFV